MPLNSRDIWRCEAHADYEPTCRVCDGDLIRANIYMRFEGPERELLLTALERLVNDDA